MHSIARAFTENSELKAPFIAALRDRAVSAAVHRMQERQAELTRVSRASILHDVVVRSVDGEGRVLDLLKDAINHVDSLIADARTAQSVLADVIAAEPQKSGNVPYRVLRAILELPGEIACLETTIRRFDIDREQYLAALREKGIDARTLAKIEPTPTHEDLAQWQRDAESKRERLARLKAYNESGPFYDPDLLGEDLKSLDF